MFTKKQIQNFERKKLISLAKLGILESVNESGKDEIQKIDDPLDFKESNDLDFLPPTISSDHEAKSIFNTSYVDKTNTMKNKQINGVDYIVYEDGMVINDPSKSYYVDGDLDYKGDIVCNNIYVTGNDYTEGNQRIEGNQYIGKNQDVRKNQYIAKNQDVAQNQYITGNQHVGKNQYIKGDQYTVGNQHVKRYQKIVGNQNVEGNQYIEKNQDVRKNQYIAKNQVVAQNQYITGNQNIGKNQYIAKNQDVAQNQDVMGNQNVKGIQVVAKNQDVMGNQNVRFSYVSFNCKYDILIDRDTENIKIGCVEKTIKEWNAFFKNKEEMQMSSSDRNYKKTELAFNLAKKSRKLLILMNKI